MGKKNRLREFEHGRGWRERERDREREKDYSRVFVNLSREIY